MYAAAGGASLAGRKARQHGRQPAPPSPDPLHPAPTGVRAYSCQHWESLLYAPPPPPPRPASEPHSPCELVEVRDASYGSSSDSDGEAEGISGEPWGVARLLYAGLGILALGLVVYFVGTGDKGFKTPELRLVGPSLIFAGLALCLLRIAFCIFAKPCCRRRTNYKENRRLSGCVEGEEMPLAGGTSRGPAQCSPARRLDASSCDVSSLSSGEEDERLRRYRTAPHHTLHPPAQSIQVAPCQSASHTTVRQSPSPQSPLPPGAVPSPSQPAPSVPGIQRSLQSAPQSALLVQNQRRPPPRNVSFASGPDGELVLSPAQLRS